MAMLGELLLQPTSTGILLGAVLMILLLVYLFSDSNTEQEGNDPPGPKPLPLLGNMLQLDLSRPHLSLRSMSKQYGSIFTVYFGLKKVVVLAGYRTVKQALVNHSEEFGERDISPIVHDLNQGFGKPFDTTHPVNCAVSNIISAIVYGSRFEYNDPRFQNMVSRANENIRLTGSASIQLYNMFPWLRVWLKNWKIIMRNREKTLKDIMQIVHSLQETLNPQDCRGLIDCFLVRKLNAKAEEKDTLYHEQNLLQTVSNLFAAGTETTSTTLRWGMLLMAKYPHIQDRVHQEIDHVIGGRHPVVEDRRNLPYTDAVIHETQRLADIVPMSLPHTTTRDVHFQGFFIKKGTCVFPLLSSVLKDETEWEHPDTFNPGHFLDEQGQFIKRDAFMPFSGGRRACLGESLARMELFLFFTSLLQHFRFTPPPGVSEDQLDLTPSVGFTLCPSPHELCAVRRGASRQHFQSE
ncbi:cytochrome P450 2K4-like isoform X2 [Brachyhypopomus gauderio]|uniref:cytochrome P450 2K4-like isoform X2 n=1 Tax=Brachyhypopomus gauderio TaxID=698409 RepID=UPI004041B125